MNTIRRRALWTAGFLGTVLVLCVAGTKISRLTETTGIQPGSLFLVVTGVTASGTLETRSIQASNMLSGLTNLPGWPSTLTNDGLTNATVIGLVNGAGVAIKTLSAGFNAQFLNRGTNLLVDAATNQTLKSASIATLTNDNQAYFNGGISQDTAFTAIFGNTSVASLTASTGGTIEGERANVGQADVRSNLNVNRLTVTNGMSIIPAAMTNTAAATGNINAGNGMNQYATLRASTNLGYVALAGADVSNSVPIKVTFTQDATGTRTVTLNGNALGVNTNAGAMTDVYVWVQNNATNVSVSIPFSFSVPSAGQLAVYDGRTWTNGTAGWGLAVQGTQVVLTNRPVSVATNAATSYADFSDGANVQIVNVGVYGTNHLSIWPTNLVVGRTLAYYFNTNMVNYNVTVSNLQAVPVAWNFNVSTNGATSFTKTNTMRARVFLTAETNGTITAEMGYYR